MTPSPEPQRAAPLTLVLAVWAAVLVLAVLQILRSSFVADLSAFLPADPDPRQRVLIEQVEAGVPARTLLLAVEGGDSAARAATSSALATRLRASGLFEQVANGQFDAYAEIGPWLFEHRYLLSPGVTPERFQAEGLRDALLDTMSLLGTPAGALVQPLFERDPSGETQRIAEGLIPAQAPRSEDGVWVSREHPRALIVAVARAAGADLDALAATIARVREDFAAVATPGLQLQLSGAPLFSVDSRSQILSEVHRLAIAGTVLVVGLLWLALGSPGVLALAALPVATGVLVGIAAVSLGFGQVHGLTLAFGVTLIGEAVDYSIFYLIQAREQGARAWLRSGWPTLRLGLLTSVCGFAALVFSGFPGLAQLGVFSVAGLVAAAATTRFVLPLLRPAGAPGTALRRAFGRAGRHLLQALPRLRWPLLALGLASAVLLATRGPLWQGDLASLSPVPAEAMALDRSLRADLSAGDDGALAVVQADTLQQVLERAEQAGVQLDALVDEGRLGGYDSVVRWLPSERTQRERLAALPEAAALRTAVQQAVSGLPVAAARLEPFVAEVQAARSQTPVELATLRQAAGGALAPLVDALMLQRSDERGGGWVALLPLAPPAGGTLDAAQVEQALAGLPGAQVLEVGRELSTLYQRYLGQAQLQALLGGAGVLLLVALTLRSPRRVLAVCLPLVLAVLLVTGALVAAGVQLGMLHLVGLLLVVAVGSNYSLFFDLVQQREADDDTLASLLLANVTTALVYGLIAVSAIPALRAIGQVVAPGALLALLLAAAFAPRHHRASGHAP